MINKEKIKILEEKVKNKTIIYIPCNKYARIFINKCINQWEDYESILFLVEDNETEEFFKLLLPYKCIKYSTYNEMKTNSELIVFFGISDIKKIEEFIKENLNNLKKKKYLFGITFEPSVFLKLSKIKNELLKIETKAIMPNLFFRQFFKATTLIYFKEFSESIALNKVWLNRLNMARKKNKSKLLNNIFPEENDIIKKLIEINMYDHCLFGLGRKFYLRSEKLVLLYKLIEKKNNEKIIIYIKKLNKMYLLYNIIQKWFENNNNEYLIGKEKNIFIKSIKNKINIEITCILPENIEEKTNLILFDFVQVLYNCNIFLFEVKNKEIYFKNLIYDDDRIKKEIFSDNLTDNKIKSFNLNKISTEIVNQNNSISKNADQVLKKIKYTEKSINNNSAIEKSYDIIKNKDIFQNNRNKLSIDGINSTITNMLNKAIEDTTIRDKKSKTTNDNPGNLNSNSLINNLISDYDNNSDDLNSNGLIKNLITDDDNNSANLNSNGLIKNLINDGDNNSDDLNSNGLIKNPINTNSDHSKCITANSDSLDIVINSSNNTSIDNKIKKCNDLDLNEINNSNCSPLNDSNPSPSNKANEIINSNILSNDDDLKIQTYCFKVFSDDCVKIKTKLEKKKFVIRVFLGHKHTSVITRCVIGVYRTLINLHSYLMMPIYLPRVSSKRIDIKMEFECNSIIIGTLVSPKLLMKKVAYEGGLVILGKRNIVVYALGEKVSIKMVLTSEMIEKYILLGLNSNGTQLVISIPLKYHPVVLAYSGNLKNGFKNKKISDKIKYLNDLDWKRVSVREIPEFEESYDIYFRIKMNSNKIYGNTKKIVEISEEENIFTDSNNNNVSIPVLRSIIALFNGYNCSILYTNICLKEINLSLSELKDNFIDEKFKDIFELLRIISTKDRLILGQFKKSDLQRIKSVGLREFCLASDKYIKVRFEKIDKNKIFEEAQKLKDGEILKKEKLKGENSIIEIESDNNINSENKSQNKMSKKYFQIFTAILTPFKTIFGYESVYEKNSVQRKYGNEHFLRFGIRDSNGAIFRNDTRVNQEAVYDYFHKTLQNGLEVWRLRYFFLAATASQMKVHKAWLVTPFERDGDIIGADHIKSWLGDFSDIKNIGKYMVRIGQALSSTNIIINIPQIGEIKDIEHNGYCFSEGVGLISSYNANILARRLGLHTVPSAFQIRYGGHKGVVAVHPCLENGELLEQWSIRNNFSYMNADKKLPGLVLRPSMRKFISQHTVLEVVSYSKSTEFYLNRQIILILEGLRVDSNIFKKLQDKYILDVLNQITGNFPKIIRQHIPRLFSRYAQSQSSFFRKLIIPSLVESLEDITQKTKIYVPEGRSAMGVLDELNILESDEVFIMYNNTKSNNSIINNFNESNNNSNLLTYKINSYGKYCVPVGYAIIAKNPCIHPGDIRVVRCVDRKELHYLKDVIVFSQKGDRPLFNQCSGSDLDGDIYMLSWHPELIPKVVYKSYNYIGGSVLEKSDVLHSDMVNFYIRYMKNFQLGLIANSFMAEADKSTIFSSRSMKLADLFNRNIDFIKTGSFSYMPEDLIPEIFPDFMETSPSYPSKRILGKLYRRSMFGNIENGCECRICIDNLFKKLEPWEVFILKGSKLLLRKDTLVGSTTSLKSKTKKSSNNNNGFIMKNLISKGCNDKNISNKINRNTKITSEIFFNYKLEINNIMHRNNILNEEQLFYTKNPIVMDELREIIDKYHKKVKLCDFATLADLCFDCKTTIKSLVWLSDEADKLKTTVELYSTLKTNCGFNNKIILMNRGIDTDVLVNNNTIINTNENFNNGTDLNTTKDSNTICPDYLDEVVSWLNDIEIDLNNDNTVDEKINYTENDFKLAVDSFYNNTFNADSIMILCDFQKYLDFYDSLHLNIRDLFNDLFSLLLLSRVFRIDQFNDIIDFMISVYSEMTENTPLEMARVLFNKGEDIMFKIGFMLCLDISLVYKALMFRTKPLIKNTLSRPPKIFCRFILMIHGMFDENEDIEFRQVPSIISNYSIHLNNSESKNNFLFKKISKFNNKNTTNSINNNNVYIPILKNKGTCSFTYYKNISRDFFINVLYSKDCLQFINDKLENTPHDQNLKEKKLILNQNFFINDPILTSRAEFILKFTPGTFVIKNIPKHFVHDKMSIKELESFIFNSADPISIDFKNTHQSMDLTSRIDFFKKAKKMVKQKIKEFLTFTFSDSLYTLVYLEGQLISIFKDTKSIAHNFIINRDLSIDSHNDLLLELFSREIIYNTTHDLDSNLDSSKNNYNFNYLNQTEYFMLNSNLYHKSNNSYLFSSHLSPCKNIKLEIVVSFANDDLFKLVHSTIFSAVSQNAIVENSVLFNCYAEKVWNVGKNFDMVFEKLWDTYINYLL